MVAARVSQKSWTERWLPYLITVVIQVIGCVWYAAHISAQTTQNSKDIAELKLTVVPRPEVDLWKSDMKDRLDAMDRKLDMLLAGPRKQ